MVARASGFILGVVLVVLGTTGAFAQQVDTEAERLFTEGVALLDSGRFADARERLQEARARQESPAVVYNLALAERGLGHYIEATALFDRWFELAGERADARRRDEVSALLREVRAGIGYATVNVAAVGAEVTVDGQPWASTRLGVSTPVNPGSHVFHASGDELRADERTVDVGQGQRVTVALAPRPLFVTGTLRVEPSVPEAVIYVDRHRTGTGLFEAEVRPGRHRVVVRAPGFPRYQTDVEVRAGQVRDLRVTLARETSVFRRWWFWAGTGAVVVGVITAVLIGTLSHTEAADGGSLGWVIQAQTAQ